MRIAFSDTIDHPQFNKPCPRCGEQLVQQIRNKYPNEQTEQRIGPISKEQELVIIPKKQKEQESIPTGELCSCCRFFAIRPEVDLCGWCVDCPSRYCDVPDRYKEKKFYENTGK
jgi:hypothetical protein